MSRRTGGCVGSSTTLQLRRRALEQRAERQPADDGARRGRTRGDARPHLAEPADHHVRRRRRSPRVPGWNSGATSSDRSSHSVHAELVQDDLDHALRVEGVRVARARPTSARGSALPTRTNATCSDSSGSSAPSRPAAEDVADLEQPHVGRPARDVALRGAQQSREQARAELLLVLGHRVRRPGRAHRRSRSARCRRRATNVESVASDSPAPINASRTRLRSSCVGENPPS